MSLVLESQVARMIEKRTYGLVIEFAVVVVVRRRLCCGEVVGRAAHMICQATDRPYKGCLVFVQGVQVEPTEPKFPGGQNNTLVALQ